LTLIFGVLAELNAQNQTISPPQASPSIIVPQKPLVQVPATPLSRSGEDDSGEDDERIERSVSEVPNSQPPTPPRVQANPWSAPNRTEKLDLQTRLGFDDKRAYNDFRVCRLSFKLTLDLVANSYG